jgi:hypothetical protein
MSLWQLLQGRKNPSLATTPPIETGTPSRVAYLMPLGMPLAI